MANGGLAKLKLVMEIDGDKVVVNGLNAVDAAVDRTAKSAQTATGRMAAGMANVSVSIGDITTGTGRMAADHSRHMSSMRSGWSDLETGLMNVQMRVMNLVMAAALLAAPFALAISIIMKGVDVADDFAVSTLQIAAQLAQMQGPKDVVQHYRESVVYAKALAEKLQEIDANSFANSKGLMAMLQVMTMQGVVLDINNRKQVEAFTSLSNAIAMYTQGQDQQMQAHQEMRALMSGRIDQHSQLARMLDSAVKQEGIYKNGLREVVALGKQHGDTLERLLPYLVGVNAATGDINRTWSAAKSSAETAVNAVVRSGFKETMVDVTGWLQQGNVYLKEHAAEIGGRIQQGWQATKSLIEASFVVLRAGGATLEATIALFQDLHNLVKGTLQTVEAGYGALQAAPGLLVPLGVAAYYAVGGIAAVTATYTALTTAIAASMAANPIGWVALGIGAIYLAAKPAVKALDELIYKQTQLSLTGEAAHNAEMKRAAEADKAWEFQKQRALFMHKEGGIPLSPGMKSALGPQAPDIPPPPSEEDEKARQAAEEWRKIYADLRKEIDLLNPALTEQDKKLLGINNRYDDLEHKKGANISRLKELRAETVAATLAQHASAMAIKETADFFKEYLRLAEAETPQHGDRGAKNIAWEKELEMLASLQPTAEADKLNEQIAMFVRLMGQIPEKSDEVAAAIAKLKQEMAKNDPAKKMQDQLADLNVANIADPYAQQMAAIDLRYERERKQIRDTMELYKDNLDLQKAGEKVMAALKVKSEQEKAEATTTSINSQRSVSAEYLTLVGGLFGELAGTIDQSSRKGFEASKAFNLAAAIASTAAAIMNQMSSGDHYTAWARAAAAGAMGAIQIAKIMSTQYGGGGQSSTTVAAPGSFGGSGTSGVGSRIGTQFLSVHDQQTEESLRQVVGALDNASIAIGKVADGLTKVADLFGEGGFLYLALKDVPGMSTKLTESSWGTGEKGELFNPNASIKSLFKSWESGFQFAMRYDPITSTVFRTLFGGGWNTTEAGLALEVRGGGALVRGYQKEHKDGGFFGSDKDRTIYTREAELTAVMQRTIDQIAATIARATVAIGSTGNPLGINMPETTIATAGRKSEDIQKDVQAWLESVADTMAKTVEGLKEFTFYGESAFDALVRLSTSLQGVNEQLSLVGANLIDSTLSGANTAYKLTEMMGGLEAFTEKTTTYFEAMFSEEEQKQRKAIEAQRQVNAAFAEMNAYAKDKLTGLNLGGFGLDIPGTREEFRDLVNGLDLTTEAGSALFAGLMDIAEAFGTVQDAADEAAEKAKEFAQLQADSYQDLEVRMLRATGQGSRADIVELLINQSKEWNDYVEKGLDTTQLATVQQLEYANAIKQAGEAAQQASDQMKNTLVDTALAAAQALKQILGGDLSTASPEQKYIQARRAWDDAMAKGQANLLPELGQSLLTASRGYNASGAGYVGDFDRVTQELADAAGIIGEPTLTAAQQQVDLLTRIKDYAGLQVDATTTLSGLMSQYLARSAAEDVMRMATGLAAADMRWDLNKSGGIDIADALLALQGQRPSYAVGTAYVPHDMTADIHQGEMIWTRQFSDGMRRYGIPVQGAADNRETVDELKKQNTLLTEQNKHLAALVKVNQAVGQKLIQQSEQQTETQDELLRVTKRSAA